MDQMLTDILPIFLFMLIPVWIPIAAIIIGNVLDRLRPVEVTPAMAAVREAKHRSAAVRALATA